MPFVVVTVLSDLQELGRGECDTFANPSLIASAG